MDIDESIQIFIDGKGKNRGRSPDERYASFDYCYNYFYSFYKENKLTELSNAKNLELSCLHLSFYLASWGMLRGSSFLLEKSIKSYTKLIIAISKTNPKLWEIDVDSYTSENIQLLLGSKQMIVEALGENNNPSDTLVTKIMLGVFANVPAFDQFVRTSLKTYKLDENSLIKIHDFYEEHKPRIDNKIIYSFDFLTGKDTNILYTKAKLVDMCCFIDGQELVSKNHKKDMSHH